MLKTLLPALNQEEIERFNNYRHQINGIMEELSGQKDTVRELLGSEYGVIIQETLPDGWNQLALLLDEQDSKLAISKKEELRNWYQNKIKNIISAQSVLDSILGNVDQEVYRLYDLTDEEVQIINNYA